MEKKRYQTLSKADLTATGNSPQPFDYFGIVGNNKTSSAEMAGWPHDTKLILLLMRRNYGMSYSDWH